MDDSRYEKADVHGVHLLFSITITNCSERYYKSIPKTNLRTPITFSITSTFTWNEQGIYCLCLVVHLISFLYLHRCINNSSVDAAATRYAYALLEAIDIL